MLTDEMMAKFNGYPPLCWDRPGMVYDDDVRISYLSADGRIIRCGRATPEQLIAVTAGLIPYLDCTELARTR